VQFTHLSGSIVAERARKNTPQFSRNDTEDTSVVGRELREAREALGITIADMAEALRIRAAHVEALEGGRFGDLPGRPYTLGFARSMARHLGLDADAVAMRLREEVTGTAPSVELIFPESTEDKRLSRAGWIAISLVLVAAAYGGWLTLGPNGDEGPPEFAMDGASAVSEPDMSGAPADGIEGQMPGATVGAEPPVEEMVPAPTEAAPASAPGTAAPQAEPPSIPPVANASAPAQVPSSDAISQGKRAPPAAATAQIAQSPLPTASGAPVIGSSAPAAAPQADDTADEEDVTPEPSAVAAAPTEAPAGRILLRAHQDSWVQIQAANGVTVVARTLRAGESYTVPDQSGLRLTTGNAGALDVVVDGQIVPSLGQVGAVRRNVALDPARLRTGTALE
jgi:cytoskeleton protein RodZ